MNIGFIKEGREMKLSLQAWSPYENICLETVKL